MAGVSFTHQPQDVAHVETKYRTIKTKIPVPESVPLLEEMYALECRAMHGQLPVIWDSADNFQVKDKWGNVWLDFTSTIFVANAGHANQRIIDRLQQLLNKPLLHSYTYAHDTRIAYLRKLNEVTAAQFEKAFMLSAGTEATEVALKLMRMQGAKEGKRKGGIVCFSGAYHGRTMGAQMMTGNVAAKEWIGHHDAQIHHLPFPYPWLEEVQQSPKAFFERTFEQMCEQQGLSAKEDICGFMIETFQGWGAVFYPDGFLEALADFAKENKILIAFDEMQAGFGRTGTLFGYEHYNIEPDLLCLGKGASSGLPLSIVMGSQELMDLPDIGSMSSTHSANPLCCAAGLANLEALFEDGLIDNSMVLGRVLHRKLSELKDRYPNVISKICGKGLLAAVIFENANGEPLSELCDKVCEKAMQKGLLLVHTGRESIKIAPPLSIEEDALIEGVDVLAECIAEAVEQTC
ncbi:aminotransferase class III-fold pyridoxal phosphate-dependent enzyme [Aestuariibacter sp. AA17]|uniref:Aminotransferase class III-fold pyridoxal phosphate-dependent enzyme n=1 Tax=Fluctibacter corallii TaxID=2984329 RepID=A0ABT3AA21_9ALTE|nr:aminotransferase class III-fold pyridoxal phosphate-dependent enzyme [Aestuariibacter sp. AA17]MCV2885440.1 aminotransferase class III-fold pyridoxal phosphate-dependent enzyme [Aestuariibacter sp. AA17]